MSKFKISDNFELINQKYQIDSNYITFGEIGNQTHYSHMYFIQNLNQIKNIWNLSQEEIDAIMKEIREEQMKFDFQYIPRNSQYNNSAPKTGEPNGNVSLNKACIHEMIPYTGLFEAYNFCKKCGQKETK